MGAHLINGEFQSDKYPTTPRGKVPLSVKDKTAQDLLWRYAQRRRKVDAEFADDLETALRAAGYEPPSDEEIDQRARAVLPLMGEFSRLPSISWEDLSEYGREILRGIVRAVLAVGQ